MSELEQIRNLHPPVPAADPIARDRVRAAVAARTYARPPLIRRARWVLPAASVSAAAVVAVVVVAVVGTSATGSARAAQLLRKAADAARTQRGLGDLGPSQFLYTKSTNAFLKTGGVGGKTFSALVPRTREVWLRRDGTGWLYQVSGAPTFLTTRDRATWIAAGRPALGADGVMDVVLRNEDGPTPPMASLDLPSDPGALYSLLQRQTKGFGSRQAEEMFTTIGDDLRENYTTPAQRAALFEVAARVPGVVYVGNVTDSAGRAGLAVAMDDGENKIQDELIFAASDYTFLGEQERALAGNSLGFPDGTVIGHAAYLDQQIVSSVPQSVIDHATS